ncbi:fimbrial protein, partial [Salmonella enterica subsp. enterica serovar Poona]|nr:fimbrial protein [Salmonella enterica subsp. enterica serovar Poona]
PVLAADYSEKTQYLGVVNGQVVGNSVVKVTRTPADPVLYRSGDTSLPERLTIRNAEFRVASGGMVYITVKQVLPDNGEARITLKTALMVDGKKVALSAGQQGEDVVITVPEAQKQVELRTDAPAELEVPANYRGNLQIALQVED